MPNFSENPRPASCDGIMNAKDCGRRAGGRGRTRIQGARTINGLTTFDGDSSISPVAARAMPFSTEQRLARPGRNRTDRGTPGSIGSRNDAMVAGVMFAASPSAAFGCYIAPFCPSAVGDISAFVAALVH